MFADVLILCLMGALFFQLFVNFFTDTLVKGLILSKVLTLGSWLNLFFAFLLLFFTDLQPSFGRFNQ